MIKLIWFCDEVHL